MSARGRMDGTPGGRARGQAEHVRPATVSGTAATKRTDGQPIDLRTAAGLEGEAVLERLGTGEGGLTSQEAARRVRAVGPNVLRSHGTRPLSILLRQLRSYLLVLLVAGAVVSAAVGERTEAGIILAIIALSVGLGFFNLGFFNEYRSEKAVEELHTTIRRWALVERDGRPQQVDVVELVPGDVVSLRVGDIVPADLRLLEATALRATSQS